MLLLKFVYFGFGFGVQWGIDGFRLLVVNVWLGSRVLLIGDYVWLLRKCTGILEEME